MNMSIMSKS